MYTHVELYICKIWNNVIGKTIIYVYILETVIKTHYYVYYQFMLETTKSEKCCYKILILLHLLLYVLNDSNKTFMYIKWDSPEFYYTELFASMRTSLFSGNDTEWVTVKISRVSKPRYCIYNFA